MIRVHPSEERTLRGQVRVPGDKSISHRALLFAALAEGESAIRGMGTGEDNAATAAALRALSVSIREEGDVVRVTGQGPGALRPPEGPIDCGNSGTTARLLAGLLAGAGVPARLEGDASLSSRPMARIADPLGELGFDVRLDGELGTLPMRVGSATPEEGAWSAPQRVVLRKASAQIKSALLLATLRKPALFEIAEPLVSRDHSERLLRAMGARIASSAHYLNPVREDGTVPTVRMHPGGTLQAIEVDVPADFSSAAFFVAAGILRGESVVLPQVGLNPTRTGLLEVLARMGVTLGVSDRGVTRGNEPYGTLHVEAASLRGTTVRREEVPRLIDELPVLCVLGAAADGELIIEGAEELRVKESDRIATTAGLLRGMGVEHEEREDGLRVKGGAGRPWSSFSLNVGADHRLALSAAVAALGASGPCALEGAEIAAVSYPEVWTDLMALGARVEEES